MYSLSCVTFGLVELEVLRGTLSSIRRKERGDDDVSVISEDLREYDDEFKLQWEERKSKIIIN